jgi:DNA-binding NarL/FixJ family response regulator
MRRGPDSSRARRARDQREPALESGAEPPPIGVLIVGELRLQGEALALALRTQPHIAVAEYRATLAEAQSAHQQWALECVLLNGDGPLDQLVEQLCVLRAATPAPKILVLAAAATPPVIAACLRAGAAACLARDASFRELVLGLQQALRGERLFTAEQLVQVAAQRPAPALAPLTAREQEVLQVMTRGLPAEEAATRLGISPATLRTHLKHAMAKLGARNRVEAVVFALQAGLIRLAAASADDVQGYWLSVG